MKRFSNFITDLEESVKKMSHGRLKFHMNNKHVPHGSFSFDQMKAERDRRLSNKKENEAYRSSKQSMSEAQDQSQLDEISQSKKDEYIKKASADRQGAWAKKSVADRTKDAKTSDAMKKRMAKRDKGMYRAMGEAKKPDAVEVIRKKNQMSSISSSDKDKLSSIRAMLNKEKKK